MLGLFWEIWKSEGTPPPPHPYERHDWRGFCKKCLQNLDDKRVRGQNLENKRLKLLPVNVASTTSALTIICLLRVKGQGQMSHRAVDYCAARGGASAQLRQALRVEGS